MAFYNTLQHYWREHMSLYCLFSSLRSNCVEIESQIYKGPGKVIKLLIGARDERVVKLIDWQTDSPLWVRVFSESESFISGGYPARLRMLRSVGGSTKVPAHAWNNARRCIRVLHHQENIEVHSQICTLRKRDVIYGNQISVCVVLSVDFSI